MIKGGRARWKIENEAFNTLKNQGYQLEHNYGHGNKYLANNFATIAMLAFLIDQVQATFCEYFQKALERLKNKKSRMWSHIEPILIYATLDSWLELFELMAGKKHISLKSSNTT